MFLNIDNTVMVQLTKKISYKQTSELEINHQVQLQLMNASCGHTLLKILFHLFILL